MDLNQALLSALEGEQVDEFAQLLALGANVNAWFRDGDTALVIAVQMKNAAIRDLLIEKGANVDLIGMGQLSALMTAAAGADLDACSALLDAGASPDVRNDMGDEALHFAANVGSVAACALLLDRGANIDCCDMSGDSPLTNAVSRGHGDVVDLLVSRGATIGVAEVEAAVSANQLKIVEQIIGDPRRADEGLLRLVMDEATAHGNVELCRQLMANGGCLSSEGIVAAARNGHVPMCEFLISQGMDLNILGAEGQGALHVAVEKGHLKVASLLLENGADANLETAKRGWTPIYEAVRRLRNERVEMFRLLVRHGADVRQECVNPQDMTPFQFAVFSGNVSAARYFAEEFGEDLEQRTIEGKTLEQLAGVWTEVVEALRSVAAARVASEAIEIGAGEGLRPPRRSSCEPL
jgi:ankyrin repeat protein